MNGRGRILIVDDDAELRSGVQEALEGAGYLTSTACDGRQALEMLRQPQLPGAILLDLMMPVMNGRQFEEAARRDPRTRDIPILVITASRDPDEEHPHDGHVLRKPFGLDDLLRTVRYLIRD